MKTKAVTGILLTLLLASMTLAFNVMTVSGSPENMVVSYEPGVVEVISLQVYDGKLYAGTGIEGKIYVYDGETWDLAYDSPEGLVWGFAVYDGRLYAGTGGMGRIYVYNGTTWSLEVDLNGLFPDVNEVRGMCVYNGKLYVGTNTHLAGGRVFVYDGVEWSLAFQAPYVPPTPTPPPFYSGDVLSLAVYDGKLYAGTSPLGEIYVYDGETWSLAYDSPEWSVWPFVEYGGKLYAGTARYPFQLAGGRIYVYDGETWSLSFTGTETGAEGVLSIISLAVFDGKLYAGAGSNGLLYVYDESAWKPFFDAPEDTIWSLAVYNNTLYAGSGYPTGKIYVSVEEPYIVCVSATVDIDPDTLNLIGNGKWVTAYIELPENYYPDEIDITSIRLKGFLPVDPDAPTEIGDYDGDGVPDLMVKFDRAEVQEYLGGSATTDYDDETRRGYEVTSTIFGSLFDGTFFEGTDTTWVVSK